MPPARMRTLLTVLLALLVTGACASADEPGGDFGLRGDLVVEVDNTRESHADLTVYILPDGGSRRRLGSVTLGARRRFAFQRRATQTRFRLFADSNTRRDLVSEYFTVTNGAVVVWNVARNTLTVTRR